MTEVYDNEFKWLFVLVIWCDIKKYLCNEYDWNIPFENYQIIMRALNLSSPLWYTLPISTDIIWVYCVCVWWSYNCTVRLHFICTIFSFVFESHSPPILIKHLIQSCINSLIKNILQSSNIDFSFNLEIDQKLEIKIKIKIRIFHCEYLCKLSNAYRFVFFFVKLLQKHCWNETNIDWKMLFLIRSSILK